MDKVLLTSEEILNLIKSHSPMIREQYTYIILGQTGPTGKSWITQKLKELHCNAIEISEYVNQHISYPVNGNYFTFDVFNKICIIMLNNNIK